MEIYLLRKASNSLNIKINSNQTFLRLFTQSFEINAIKLRYTVVVFVESIRDFKAILRSAKCFFITKIFSL